MRFSFAKPLLLLGALASYVTTPVMAAEQMLVSKSLNTCQDDSSFTASLFNVVFTPNNGSAAINIVAVSSVQGSIVFDVAISVYGYEFMRRTVDPCSINLAGLCPMTAGKITMNFNLQVGEDAVSQIPGIAYNIPDLDATVKVYVNMTDTKDSVACVEADISNGKTVDLIGVKWATAIIAGLGLIASAVVSGLGHSNTAAHVAANTLSLFGYFQSQAIVGLTGIHLPPIVQSWTQDFVWSMGIIRVQFMQDIFTWYQRATGGTPATLLNSLTTTSVQVEKRSLDWAMSAARMAKRGIDVGMSSIARRANIQLSSGSYIVFGIQRVAFRAKIESTNLFMTGLAFFCIFVIFTVLGVAAFKGFCELAVRQKWMKSEKFLEFRNGWFTVLKGILFRMTLIGFPQMTILCLWEFTQVDSAAEVVLAVFFLFGMALTLGWAAAKVVRIARRSVAMHRNPAYILFSDPQALNKWGFLYVQFRASAYYFIIPVLGYTVVKGAIVAFAQRSGTVQAIAFVIIEAGALIAASVLRPWMDKSTNSFNIAICVMNFLNAVFLLIFSNVFGAPALVNGVVGVVLFVGNAAFSLILLLLVIVSSTLIFFRKNPDARYQFMADDRASFMKSQTQLNTTTELDALAATARGDKAHYNKGLDLDDDNDSISSESMRRRADPSAVALPPSTAQSHNSQSQQSFQRQQNQGHQQHSPVDPSVPLFPANAGPYGQPPTRTPSPYNGSGSTLSANQYRQQNNGSPAQYRQQNNASPWQRGAGYEH
ncbi:putative flavin carrier protein 3 [Colletotrichum sp. SAR11_59]|uniref:Calcium-related spray protein n=1 Tax=Colletotrichum asianum TaxID=702518 RepID=A0A8H3ZPG5_9PEZI|nr:calcium-related spray protein [Colletotrichum asianum]KAI8310106.1 putative flavin carrier protein 3 [Colletotrichum sp. SAR11_59]